MSDDKEMSVGAKISLKCSFVFERTQIENCFGKERKTIFSFGYHFILM